MGSEDWWEYLVELIPLVLQDVMGRQPRTVATVYRQTSQYRHRSFAPKKLATSANNHASSASREHDN